METIKKIFFATCAGLGIVLLVAALLGSFLLCFNAVFEILAHSGKVSWLYYASAIGIPTIWTTLWILETDKFG